MSGGRRAGQKLSLNERFKQLRQPTQQKQQPQAVIITDRDHLLGSGGRKPAAVRKNQVAMSAALRLKQRSIKQRLGVNAAADVRSRLAGGRLLRSRFRSDHMDSPTKMAAAGGRRLNRGNFVGTQPAAVKVDKRIRNQIRQEVMEELGVRAISQALTQATKKSRVGMRVPVKARLGPVKGQKVVGKNKKAAAVGANKQRANLQAKMTPKQKKKQLQAGAANRKGKQLQTGKQRVGLNQNRKNMKNKKQGKVGQGPRWKGKAPNKDRLDADIDKYMSKTKGSLNSELDAYMNTV